MDDGNRKFSTEKPKSAPTMSVQRLSTHGTTWSGLAKATYEAGATAIENTYLRPHPSGKTGNFLIGSMTTVHAHGNFGHSFDEESGPNPNVSTQVPNKGAYKHDKLIEGSGDQWAQNTMRVLKGTSSLNKPLTGTESQAQGAVVLAHEIGVSEVARGGEAAMLSAMSSMYLAKHKRQTGSDFQNPDVGFHGAGKGGAEKLRTLSEKPWYESMHLDPLKQHFDEVASKKEKWKGASFEDWVTHKRTKWTQKL